MIRKQFKAALMIGLLCFLMGKGEIPLLQASCTNCTNVTNLEIDGTGIYDSNDTLRLAIGSGNSLTGTLTVSGNQTITAPSDQYFGSASAAVSTATTAGTSQGSIFTGYLAPGGPSTTTAVTEGMVLCATTTHPSSGNTITLYACPGSSNTATWVGIAAAAASTGSVVNVFNSGWVNALATGTVAPGDLMVTNGIQGAPGYLMGSNSGYSTGINFTTASVVGVALTSGTANGGLFKMRLR